MSERQVLGEICPNRVILTPEQRARYTANQKEARRRKKDQQLQPTPEEKRFVSSEKSRL